MKKLAIALMLAIGLAVPSATLFAGSATAGAIHKSYVCKYVGTPGVDERLQTGQNPIWVDNHSIAENPVVQGSFFKDAQGRSYVLVANTDKLDPEPDASACPLYDPKVVVEGPCGDPQYGFIFDNTGSNIDVTFTVTTPYKTRSYVVAGGATLEKFSAATHFHTHTGDEVTVVASATDQPDKTLADFTAVRSRGVSCPWQNA
jgi:hypothetical protein